VMKKLSLVFLLVLIASESWAQPACPGSYSTSWNNCVGTNTGPDGDKYVGEWKDGKKHGQGTETWPDGEKYIGGWKDDKHHGQGTMTYADGTTYIGEHKDGKFNGQGTLTSPDGRKVAVIWENGGYLGTVAEVERKRQAEEDREKKYNKIYNACI